jgi:hypothetical protein
LGLASIALLQATGRGRLERVARCSVWIGLFGAASATGSPYRIYLPRVAIGSNGTIDPQTTNLISDAKVELFCNPLMSVLP